MRKNLARRDSKFCTFIKGQNLYIENYFLGTPPQVLPLHVLFFSGAQLLLLHFSFSLTLGRISLDQVKSSEGKFTQEHVKQKHKTTIWKWKFAMTSSVKDHWHWHWHWSINGHCCIIDVKVIVRPNSVAESRHVDVSMIDRRRAFGPAILKMESKFRHVFAHQCLVDILGKYIRGILTSGDL